ncbi:hypothetical protein ACJIZ3_025123 [Penstemon smallii]|uniref:Remorin C-terminal domain-containing protein n=1 Tax=Penstemon smallii TaxID=265156 RepID=A0ABD3TWD4_9LAMI
MESLIKQTRSRFAGTRQENKEESSNTRDRKVPPQKTQPLREKTRSQSWIRRQLSRNMSWDYDFGGADYPTAVAAAAYAVHSVEQQSKTRDDYRDRSFNSKIKSKSEDTKFLPEPRKSAVKIPDETSKRSYKDTDIKVPINTSTRPEKPRVTPTPSSSTKKKINFDETSSAKPEKLALPERSVDSPSTIADKHLNITDGKEPDQTTVPKPFNPVHPQTKLPMPQPVETRTKPGPRDSMANAWEKEEMASIKERYDKLKDTIENWETKKKRKAKRKLEKMEGKPDKKRVKAVRSYHDEIARIEVIAGGAKAQAEENRRNEEFKVKQKANKIRSTGKLPPTCLCF